MKRITILILCIICAIQVGRAQHAMFAKSGTVTFDKTMYMKNIVRKQFIEKADERSKSQFEHLLPNIPENVVLKKKLQFKGDEVMFGPEKQELDQRVKQFIMMLALDFDAITLSNLKTKDYKRFNDVIGQKLIIQDTVKKINWTITDEYREIAGYNCRRANGITPDSTYVVGFYTNDILIDGGPESINGLPGLILGLVVPSQHVSYFATKVEVSDNVLMDKKVFENSKTKTMSRAQMAKQFSESLSGFLNKETVAYIIKLGLL